MAVITGILLSCDTCKVANTLELATGPITRGTLSWVISFVIALVASDGSDLLSANTNLICLPRTPPDALASLKAN